IGDDLRVDVRVQDATGGGTESSIAETGTESRLFDVVSRVGARMRQTLGVQSIASTSSTQALGALPEDPATARLYAEGLDKMRGFDALDARDLFERALRLEPDQPLLHAALANAWSTLGYDQRAKDEAKRAFELSAKLPREQRLLIEAGYRESIAEWMRATDIYRALTSFFPDNLEYGLHLANAQTRMGNPTDALVTTEWLHRLPEPLGSDPRIDLAEMDAAATLADYKRMNAVAVRAIAKGEARGARLLVARALSGVGVANHRQGRTTEAIAAQERALTIYRDANDRAGEARSLLRIGAVYVYRGEVQRARRYFVDALAIGEDLGDAWLQSAGCNNLAFCSFTVGDPRAAEALLARQLRLGLELGDRKIEATAHDNIGYAYYLRGDLDNANEHFTESAGVAREMKAQQLLAVATGNLGDVLLARGDLAGARREYEEALAIRGKIGEKRGVAESHINLANVAIEDGRFDDAEKLARDAAKWAGTAKVWDVEALARTALARALLDKNLAADAQKEIDVAAKLADARENVIIKIAVHAMRARVLAATDRAEAVRVADAAVALATGDLIAPRLDARYARADVATGSDRTKRMAEVAREASARGFALIAHKSK
ncbi:MAG TPA: tetratricopeptide repeat protein, partial [Thermoanaerobaculia bacterium]|nr:tetratricopeptide repeat protein [Thermoanaerobaculia bacterium]